MLKIINQASQLVLKLSIKISIERDRQNANKKHRENIFPSQVNDEFCEVQLQHIST
jgi:hypothetical protein